MLLSHLLRAKGLRNYLMQSLWLENRSSSAFEILRYSYVELEGWHPTCRDPGAAPAFSGILYPARSSCTSTRVDQDTPAMGWVQDLCRHLVLSWFSQPWGAAVGKAGCCQHSGEQSLSSELPQNCHSKGESRSHEGQLELCCYEKGLLTSHPTGKAGSWYLSGHGFIPQHQDRHLMRVWAGCRTKPWRLCETQQKPPDLLLATPQTSPAASGRLLLLRGEPC